MRPNCNQQIPYKLLKFLNLELNNKVCELNLKV